MSHVPSFIARDSCTLSLALGLALAPRLKHLRGLVPVGDKGLELVLLQRVVHSPMRVRIRVALRLEPTPLRHDHPVLQLIQQDDDAAVEEIFLEDMAEEATHHLAEGAAWVSALRPYWDDLETHDRLSLEQLIVYFAKVAKRLE